MTLELLLGYGGIVGGTFVVLYVAVKTVDKFLGTKSRTVPICPLNNDPEFRAILTQQTEQMTELLRLSARQIDVSHEGQNDSSVLLNRLIDLVQSMQTRTEVDHRGHDIRLEELRRAVGNGG